MNNRRSMTYQKFWSDLIETYGSVCFYCRDEIATTIDHVIPYSWDQDNAIDNLVPACGLCNSLASNKIFETVFQKQAYILKQRAKEKNRRAICTDCLLPFSYRSHSPSLFLCAECYDEEYETIFSFSPIWKKWLLELVEAGIMVDAHRKAKEEVGCCTSLNKKTFISVLIEEYAKSQ